MAAQVFFLFTPVFALHFFAMRGAHQGKRYGRIISFLYGVLVSAMFPLGTYLAFYTFSRLGTNWEGDKHLLNGRESYWETSERLSISSPRFKHEVQQGSLIG